ncbi:alpha/beta hydrolase fold domain-containing protein [Kineococcus sp. R8]|uniref:alpha/beta hydrolase n=1 Tax=Kineococcus siccus TaxID=2696567 RepID=UPI001411C115|nr:alpha/beta hydrolase [Kineococcus siccus]NAZ84195.1 alpha/beta hydrolase fold domain-containing protein [Kineococcus siccus]
MSRWRPPEPTTAVAEGPHGPVPLRVYAGGSATALLWCHGGGFTAGDLTMPEAHGVATVLAHEAGVTVVTVDYRLAGRRSGPGGAAVRWPVPSDDVVAAWRWLQAWRPGGATPRLHLGGASAGANLAAGAALRLGAEDGPRSLLLAYPTLHVVQPPPGAELAAAVAALPPGQRFDPPQVRGMYAELLGPEVLGDGGGLDGGGLDGGGATVPVEAVPGTAPRDRLATLPPTLVLLSEVDGLRPSGEAFVASLTEAGVPVRRELEPGTLHGHLDTPQLPGAAASLGRMAGWLSGGWSSVR